MKINPEKYNQKIVLLCPVCGNSEMEHSEDSDIIKCISCGKESTKDELIQDNGTSIELQVDEIKKEIVKDVKKEIDDMLKKAFKGNKNIRFK